MMSLSLVALLPLCDRQTDWERKIFVLAWFSWVAGLVSCFRVMIDTYFGGGGGGGEGEGWEEEGWRREIYIWALPPPSLTYTKSAVEKYFP